MKRTRASNYKHRVEIQKNTPARGGTGETTKSWALWKYRKASIEPLMGKELFAAQQFQSESTVRIKIRHDNEIDVMDIRDYRIVYNSKTYEFQSIINAFEANKELHIMCSIHNE